MVGDPRKDVEFLATMPADEYERYRGEWVTVADAKIVAHGKDPRRVHQEESRAGRGAPLMEYIYADWSEVPFAYRAPDR